MNAKELLDDVTEVISDNTTFKDLLVGEHFATVANRRIVVWIKTSNYIQFAPGEKDDGWTCPMSNAITIFGFDAVFHDSAAVMRVSH